MLKKPSAPVFPATARPPSSGAMEVESTRVHTLADGKKLIDVTLRRPDKQFEDEGDDSSSSDSDNGADAHRGAPVYSSPIRRPQSGRHYHPHDEGSEDNNNKNNNNSESAVLEGYQQRQPAIQNEFKWDASSVNDIQQLTNANSQLVSQATGFKRQIKSLQIQLEALAPVPGLNPEMVQDILLEREGGPEHDIRDAKIVHQAKTLRHLKRTLQREKQLAVDAVRQCKQLEIAKQTLERENETLRLKAARFQARASAAASTNAMAQAGSALVQQDDTQPPEHGSQPSTTSSSSGEAAQQVRKKLEDLKTKHDKLQLDFKKLHRALQREVGDDVPLEEILDGAGDLNGGKRGRAQQIVMLKAKVKKLEAGSGSNSSDVAPGPLALSSNNVDVRAQHELAGQQAQKQRLVDKLTLERDEAQAQLAQASKKYEAVKSRSQTLEKDKQESRAKFQLLVDKSKNDDALIDALQRQLETWKTKVQEVKRARTAESVSNSSQKDDRNAELEKLRGIVAEYKRQGVLPSQPSQSSTLSIATSMPVLSEASQFRTMAAEKERLHEVVKALQIQLDEKERQLRQLKQQPPPPVMMKSTEDASMVSRIPRKPGMPALGRVGSNLSGSVSQLSQQQSEGDLMHGAEVEALRRTFRESLRAKEDDIAALTNRLHDLQEAQQEQQRNQETSPRIDGGGGGSSSDDMALEVQDLQEENAFLRQEFDKLKTRYEALVRNAKAASTGGSSKAK